MVKSISLKEIISWFNSNSKNNYLVKVLYIKV